jgi:hypothetical protein
MNQKTLFLLGALFGLAAILIPALPRGTNCGGNSATLAQIFNITLIARIGAQDSPEHSFRFTAVNSQQREQLSDGARNHWLPGARFLLSTIPVSMQEDQPRRIIVVCNTPYRNVPRKWIGSAPLTHAAGFSDGTCSLISPAEFGALDFSTFASLDKLYPLKDR